MTSKKEPVIGLLGQPNSGKSTLFNTLTGLHQHVGNWPGKTVEKKEGFFVYNETRYLVADLPGTYSLSANSDEEIITRDYIASGKADVVCILADASQLERSLFMVADFAGITTPAFLLLNMSDVAQLQGKTIDTAAIEKKLGIPVVMFSAPDKKNYNVFYKALENTLKEKPTLNAIQLENEYSSIPSFNELKELISSNKEDGRSPLWLAAKAIEGDAPVCAKIKENLSKEKIAKFDSITSTTKNGALLTGECKFKWIDSILEGAVTGKKKTSKLSNFDKKATSRKWGKPIAVGIILLGLIASFIPAAPFMGLGGAVPSLLNPPIISLMEKIGAHPIITSFICDILINSISFAISMIGFVFGITLVFGFIEEIGYMARISYVFDNTMSKFGLQGKAIMPFLVSFGCTIGGAASTRVIDNWGQKVLTIALAWAVPCAATWAIIPYLSSLFFGGAAPVVIIAIFAVMILHIWVTSKVFGRKLVKAEDRTGLIMELPPYHRPKWGALLRYVFGRTKDIAIRAFRVIILISFIFWLLSYTKDGNVQSSLIYKFGTFIEPFTRIFGLGWQTFLAFVSAAISKEGALGVLNALYSGSGNLFNATYGGGADMVSLATMLQANVSKPEALAFIFAVTFNIPCIVALASTYNETHSAKWTLRIALYYICMALIISFLVYHVGMLIF